jgi:adenylate cyclase
VTVLFCDLRGFSRQAERSADALPELLNRVRSALQIMSEAIASHGGVIGDFVGDAALGFWGWPLPDSDSKAKACEAALQIQREFASRGASESAQGQSAEPWRAGVGIAHGPAVAGKIGTREQAKITVFGPVVNLASRLESMTKSFGVSILIDAEVSAALAERPIGRARRFGPVVPYGFEHPVAVAELVPPATEPGAPSDADLEIFANAVEAFQAGQWDQAYRFLHKLPADDRSQDFFNQRIAASGRQPPPDWDGVIRLAEKRAHSVGG